MRLSFLLLLALTIHANAKDLTTASLGIPNDGKTICTQQLQKAIDQLSAQSEGGRLIITKGTYLTGGLLLRSGVGLHLEEDAILLGSTNPRDYTPISTTSHDDKRNDNGNMALLTADHAKRIAITGKGTIDGQGLLLALNIDSLHHTGECPDPHYNQRRQRPSETARPKLFFFHSCDSIRIEGITCRNSSNWGLSFDLCNRLSIQHVKVENRAYWNNDGIDLTDCTGVHISHCDINAADDGICLKSYHTDACCRDIHVEQCRIRSSASALKFGTASWGGFRNIHISDIRIEDTFRSAIAIESVDGAQIDSILVERIEAKNTGNPIFLRLGQRAGQRKGSLRNVTLRQITCQVPFGRPDEAYDLRGPEVNFFHNPFPSSICGIPGNPIENVLIEDVSIEYPGRSSRAMAYVPLWDLKRVPEQVEGYPEFTMFGELPAWGFFVRHARGITFRRVKLSLADPQEFRPPFVFDDAEDIRMDSE